MESTSFVVSRFENRNGVTSWRVSGWLHGVRVRRNFRTREEAASEKAALELKVLQEASGLRSLTTFLTPDQLREAEAAGEFDAAAPLPGNECRLGSIRS